MRAEQALSERTQLLAAIKQALAALEPDSTAALILELAEKAAKAERAVSMATSLAHEQARFHSETLRYVSAMYGWRGKLAVLRARVNRKLRRIKT